MSNTQQLPCLVVPADHVEFEAQSNSCFRIQVVADMGMPNVFLSRDSQLILLHALAANLGRTVTEEQEQEAEEPTKDAMNITATETADAEGTLLLPCRSNRPGGDSGEDFLWSSSRRPVGLDSAGASMQMAVLRDTVALPPLLDRVFLDRQSVINLTVQLTDWLFDTQQEGNTQEGADECSKPSTNDSSQDTASPSESSASNSELMAEMVSQIVLCFAQEVVSALSNSSSRASSCDPSNDCGDSC